MLSNDVFIIYIIIGVYAVCYQMGNVNVTSKYFELAENIDTSNSQNLLNK